MTKEEKDILELSNKLNKWNEAYYSADQNHFITDEVYDKELRKLKDLEAQYPEFIVANSPTQKVGTTQQSTFAKVEHIRPMLSLDNAFDQDDMNKFFNGLGNNQCTFKVQPKLDGVSLSLIYEEGKLVRAVTRGNGIIGDDITENAKMIKGIPHQLNQPLTIEVRGEVVMEKERFHAINKEREAQGLDLFANPRNLTAGTMRLKDVDTVKERQLNFIAYYLGDTDGIETEEQALALLESLLFNVVASRTFTYQYEVMESIKKMESNRDNFPYEIDGTVIKIDNFTQREQIGYTSKFPKWAIAYKFEQQLTPTVLEDIFMTIGRTGKVTYNAKLTPVHILGSTVTFATLHNAEYIKDLDLRIGDTVGVIKSGEIIPKVIKVLERGENTVKWEEPTTCVQCGDQLHAENGIVDKFCKSGKCTLIPSLTHFVSRNAMNISGLSEALLSKLVEYEIIQDKWDIFKIKEGTLSKIEGLGKKSEANLLDSITKARNIKLANFIAALGIPMIGLSTSKEIAKIINTFPELFSKIEQLKVIGEAKFNSLSAWSTTEEAHRALIGSTECDITNNPIVRSNGIKVAITGAFEDIKRNEIKEILEARGYETMSSVSAKTNLLIYGNKAVQAKVDKVVGVAGNRAINMTTRQELMDFLEGENNE